MPADGGIEASQAFEAAAQAKRQLGTRTCDLQRLLAVYLGLCSRNRTPRVRFYGLVIATVEEGHGPRDNIVNRLCEPTYRYPEYLEHLSALLLKVWRASLNCWGTAMK
jgi:hypothetical protein